MTILGQPNDKLKGYMANIAKRSPLRLVRSLAAPFASDTDEVSSVISSVIGQLGFLLDDALARSMIGRSSFQWDDIKRGGVSLFFILPEAESIVFTRYARLFWASCINAMYRPPAHPVLCVVDEAFSTLGSSAPELFEHAFALAPGFGLRVHLVYQNLPQVQAQFGNQWQSIMGAAGLQQFFAPADLETAKYLVERIGNRTVTVTNVASSYSVNTGADGTTSGSRSTNISTQYFDRPLWTVQELLDMPDDRQLLLFSGLGKALYAARKPYWYSDFHNRFDANPYAPTRR